MDSKDIYICGSVKTHTILQKNSGHLEFQRKHAAILDFVCFWTFFKKIFSSFVCITAQYNYVVNSDAAYSEEETINKIKLLSLPIKSLL